MRKYDRSQTSLQASADCWCRSLTDTSIMPKCLPVNSCESMFWPLPSTRSQEPECQWRLSEPLHPPGQTRASLPGGEMKVHSSQVCFISSIIQCYFLFHIAVNCTHFINSNFLSKTLKRKFTLMAGRLATLQLMSYFYSALKRNRKEGILEMMHCYEVHILVLQYSLI